MFKRLLGPRRTGLAELILVITSILILLGTSVTRSNTPVPPPVLGKRPDPSPTPFNPTPESDPSPTFFSPTPDSDPCPANSIQRPVVYLPLMAGRQTPTPTQEKTTIPTPVDPCAHLVTRQGDQFFLEGKPFPFVGTNVSYLMEDYFPEAEAEKAIAYLAAAGATALRVWLYPQHNLDRAARLFDLGRKYGLRFVVTLENYYFDKGSWWFDNSTPYRTVYLPHVRRTVAHFRDRPEIMIWELMNEPNCSGDTIGNCPDNMVRWAKAVSEEIKALDPCHLISVGVIRIDPTAEHYERLHALPSIDVVSIHKGADVWPSEEIEIARKLNKPVLIGEVYSEAYDKGCQRLYDRGEEKRAAIIAADMARAWATGVDGYLLWQYGHGSIMVGKEISHYCGIHDYMRDDPVWQILKAAPVPRLPCSR